MLGSRQEALAGHRPTPGDALNAEELEHTEETLRAICNGRNLEWLIADVDEILSEGLSTVEYFEYYREARPHPFGWYSIALSSSKAPTEATTRTTPATPTERVILIIDALIAIFTDLPTIASEVSTLLQDGWEGRAPVVRSLNFAEEDIEATAIDAGALLSDVDPRIIELLLNLREVVNDNVERSE